MCNNSESYSSLYCKVSTSIPVLQIKETTEWLGLLSNYKVLMVPFSKSRAKSLYFHEVSQNPFQESHAEKKPEHHLTHIIKDCIHTTK